MHPSLKHIEHRPWPLTNARWTWRQSWLNLAFIHYRVEREMLATYLPQGVHLQEFDGSPWVGVVPFRMAGVSPRPLPDVPLFSKFLELNLRTYVEVEGKPGVWFLSLDAASWPCVCVGRGIYRLPYYYARMRMTSANDGYAFSSVRNSSGVTFSAHYRPTGDVFFAERGSFEHWAAERYCLYSSSPQGKITRVEVHHAPWPLQKGEVVIDECDLMSNLGIVVDTSRPICHFSSGVDVISFDGETVEMNEVDQRRQSLILGSL